MVVVGRLAPFLFFPPRPISGGVHLLNFPGVSFFLHQTRKHHDCFHPNTLATIRSESRRVTRRPAPPFPDLSSPESHRRDLCWPIPALHLVVINRNLMNFRSQLIWVLNQKNRGTVPPKSSILIRFSTINHPFWSYPYFWKHPYKFEYPKRIIFLTHHSSLLLLIFGVNYPRKLTCHWKNKHD